MLSMPRAYTATVFTVGLAGLTTDGHNIAIVPLSSQVAAHPVAAAVLFALVVVELQVLEMVWALAVFLEGLLLVAGLEAMHLEAFLLGPFLEQREEADWELIWPKHLLFLLQ